MLSIQGHPSLAAPPADQNFQKCRCFVILSPPVSRRASGGGHTRGHCAPGRTIRLPRVVPHPLPGATAAILAATATVSTAAQRHSRSRCAYRRRHS